MVINFPDLEDVAFDFGWDGDVKQMVHDLIWVEGLHQGRVAHLLGIERSTVAKLMRRYDIQSNGIRDRAGGGQRGPRYNYSQGGKFA